MKVNNGTESQKIRFLEQEERIPAVQSILVVIMLSFLLFLLFAGVLSPLVIRKEKSSILSSRIFMCLILGSGIVLVGISVWTGLSDSQSERTYSPPLFALLVLTVMVVGASGTMLYELSLKRHMEQIETNKLRQLYPESPWRWSKRWQSNRIEYSDKGEMIFSYFLAATIIAVIPLSFLLNPEAALRRFYENRMDSLVILSMLVLAVIFSVRFAVNATYAWRKFKRSTFIMSTFPAVIGGTLEGEIQTMCNLVPYEGFDLKLSCVEVDITFQQSFHSITETVLWESQKKVRIEDIRMGPRGISFPVSFTIPLNTDETDTTSRDRRIHWILTAHGACEKHCISAVFKVPVFRVNHAHLVSNLPSSRTSVVHKDS